MPICASMPEKTEPVCLEAVRKDDVCEQQFKSAGNLKQHRAHAHDIGMRWHSCDVCEQQFKQAGNLKQHRAHAHDIGVQWHSCDVCEQQFKQARNLKEHRANVHNVDVQWHSCGLCEQQFKQGGALKKHRANLDDVDVLWHSCDLCEQQFKQAEPVCFEAVRQNGDALHHVPETMRTEPVCLEAMRTNGRSLRLATDFSGIETPSMALSLLQIPFSWVSACENARHLRAFIADIFSPAQLTGDVFARAPVACDLYTTGPPCVRFSHLGLRRGEPVADSSTLEQSIIYIEREAPSMFILENVVGLVTIDGGAVLAALLVRLRGNGRYCVEHRVLNTLTFGLPQSRHRVYVVGVRTDVMVSPIVFPVGREPVALVDFLDPLEAGDSPHRLPQSEQKSARQHVVWELERLAAIGETLELDRVMDVDCAQQWGGKSKTWCPCLTRSRTRGLWLLRRGRRMRASEALRLQGVDESKWVFNMSSAQKFAAAGNCMSIPILCDIVVCLLRSAGWHLHRSPNTVEIKGALSHADLACCELPDVCHSVSCRSCW